MNKAGNSAPITPTPRPKEWHTGTGEHWSMEVRNPRGDGIAFCGGTNGPQDAAYIVTALNAYEGLPRKKKSKP